MLTDLWTLVELNGMSVFKTPKQICVSSNKCLFI